MTNDITGVVESLIDSGLTLTELKVLTKSVGMSAELTYEAALRLIQQDRAEFKGALLHKK